MAFIEVSDKLKAELEAVVADGRAQSVSELVKAAVADFIEESVELTEEGYEAVRQGLEDFKTGRYVTISTLEEQEAFWAGIMDLAKDEVDDLL